MTTTSGGTDNTSELKDNGPLARLATFIVRGALVYAMALLAFSIYSHARWITPAAQVRAYLIPLCAIALFVIVLTRRATSRIAAALIIIPLVLIVVAANLAFADSNRRIHRFGWRFMSERSRQAIAMDLRKQGIRAVPFVTPAEFNYGEHVRIVGGERLLPLAGISNARTVLCAEGGDIIAYDSDENGFNNPRGLWRADSVDVALIGDSFVFGACVPARQHFLAIVRREFPRTISVSGLGNGPLTELAQVREYVSRVRPRHVLWFFFEGNDLEDLVRERQYFLRQYLDPSFSQRLAERQDDVDSTLTAYADSLLDIAARGRPLGERVRRFVILRDLRIGWTNASGAERSVEPDFATLRIVLSEATRTIEAWGGTMTLVYLPEQHRMQPDVPQSIGRTHDVELVRSTVDAIARDIGLPILDIGQVFANDPDPDAVWWRPRTHYSPYGNRALGNAVVKYLRQNEEPIGK